MGPGDNSNPGVYFLIGSGTPGVYTRSSVYLDPALKRSYTVHVHVHEQPQIQEWVMTIFLFFPIPTRICKHFGIELLLLQCSYMYMYMYIHSLKNEDDTYVHVQHMNVHVLKITKNYSGPSLIGTPWDPPLFI